MVHIRQMTVIFLVMVLTAVLAACGPQETAHLPVSETPTSAPLRILDDTEWALTSLNGNSPVEGSVVTLAFHPGSYMDGAAGCNSYGVDYIADGNRLQVPEIHRTRDTCDAPDIMQQEAAFFEALTNVAAYRATKERLEFDDAQGHTILAFARVPPPTTGSVLPGTKWVLTSLQGQPLVSGTTISLNFEREWLSGFAGCNAYGGGPDSGGFVATDEGSLTIPMLAVTVQLCLTPEGVMEQEQAYVAAFTSAATYRLREDRLELQDATGETILVYARQPECAEPPADLAGTGWQLVSVDGQDPMEGSDTTLAFLDDQWLVEYSKCEAYIKAYQTAGHELDLVFEAWLGRTCQDEAIQGTVMLSSPAQACLSQGQLQITTVPGQVFVYEPLTEAARPALEGPTWTLLAAVEERRPEGLPVPVPDPNLVLEGTEITLTLKGGTAQGSAGCNTYGAAYSLDGTSLAFGDVAATERDCPTPEGVMEQEQRYLVALKDVTGYHIYGRQLWLMVGDGRALVFSVKA
ncbi:MAG: META domain-containing protein [Ardenticatenia bacterium]|nr:META domain-containing protein [Ardenticatenia bacterium]